MCASNAHCGVSQSEDGLGFDSLGAGVLGAVVAAAVLVSDFVVSDFVDSVEGVSPGDVVDEVLFGLSVL